MSYSVVYCGQSCYCVVYYGACMRLFKSRVRYVFCKALQRHNSPVDCARELFKASTD